MERHFENSLRALKEQLVEMAGLVERAIENATEVLVRRDREKIAAVMDIEKRVNEAHIAVDNSCVKLLALQQPLAADLRLVVAIIKINTDLERMGDQAVNITHNSERYLKGEAIRPLANLPRMVSEVQHMVREAIDSFVRVDSDLARAVLRRDDVVDGLKNTIFREVIDYIKQSPDSIEQGLNLILVARNLERIGDHATNIAEDVIFAISGEDVRHTQRATT